MTADGNNLGTVNIMDAGPREFSATDLAILTDLAAVVMDELELRFAALRTVRLESDLRLWAEAETERLTILNAASLRWRCS